MREGREVSEVRCGDTSVEVQGLWRLVGEKTGGGGLVVALERG